MTVNVLDRQPIRLAADVGGTFTDVAAFDEADRRACGSARR